MSTHREDQVQAASAEAEQRLDTAGAGVYAVPGVWLAAHQANLALAGARGEVRACRHLSNSPEVVHAFAHRPTEFLCLGCFGAACDELADEDCDVCGRAESSTRILVQLGPVLLALGTCPECRPLVVAA